MRTLIHVRRLIPAIVIAAFLTACGGRAINKKTAQDVLTGNPAFVLKKDDVHIESVNPTGSRDAVVEARIKAALRYEKVNGNWVIREIRMGQGQWQKVDEILRNVQQARVDETRRVLDQVAEAVAKYRLKNGDLPNFRDYVSLSDILAPEYLNPLIRLDAWQHPLAAFRLDPVTVRIVSPGADGMLGSNDDIELIRIYK